MSHPSLLIFSVRCILLLFYANFVSFVYNVPMFVINQNCDMKILNITRAFLRSIVRFLASLCSQGSLVLLSKLGRLLFSLVAVGLLSVALIACAGGGGGSGGSSGGSMN